ncbi:MAG: hypothetical protein SFX74_01635 [Fimbriimonadaceae bacterium]|nr:hypothetical protein [Fimbriimonadaceae bacterium]
MADESSVPGNVLLPRLAVGCLLFALLMSVGVFGFAQITKGYFESQSRKNAPNRDRPAPPNPR